MDYPINLGVSHYMVNSLPFLGEVRYIFEAPYVNPD